jgi:hypothetical protein
MLELYKNVYIFAESLNQSTNEWEIVQTKDKQLLKKYNKQLKQLENDKKKRMEAIYNGQKEELEKKIKTAENTKYWEAINMNKSEITLAYLTSYNNDNWVDDHWSLRTSPYQFGKLVDYDEENFPEKMIRLIEDNIYVECFMTIYEESDINGILNDLNNANIFESKKKEIKSFVFKNIIEPMKEIKKTNSNKLRMTILIIE